MPDREKDAAQEQDDYGAARGLIARAIKEIEADDRQHPVTRILIRRANEQLLSVQVWPGDDIGPASFYVNHPKTK